MSGGVGRTASFITFSLASTLMGASLLPFLAQSGFAQSDVEPGLNAPLSVESVMTEQIVDGLEVDGLGADGISSTPTVQIGGPVRLVPRRLTPARSSSDGGSLDAALESGLNSKLKSDRGRDVIEMGEESLTTPIAILGPPVGADKFELLSAPPGGEGSGIQVGVLGRVDEASVGLFSEHDGGLGSTMWLGTDRALVEEGLSDLVVPLEGRSLQELTKRFLLSTATAPGGVTQGRSLLALRLEKLNAAGLSDQVRRLVRQAGLKRIAPETSVQIARAFLANGDKVDACRFLRALPAGGDVVADPVAAFTMKMTAYCQMIGGDGVAANLTLDLAREKGLDAPLYFALMAKAIDGITLPANIPAKLSVFDLVLFDEARQAVPKDVVERVELAGLPALARNTRHSLLIRLSAGELAAGYGLISASELADLYLEASDVPQEGSDKVDKTGAGFVRARAYRETISEAIPQKRSRLVSGLVGSVPDGAVHRALVDVVQPALATAPPSRAVLEDAPKIIRVLIEQGDRVRSGMWLNMVRETGAAAPGLVQLDLMHLILTLPDNGLVIPERASQLLLAATAAGGPDRDFAAVCAVLFDPLGIALDGAVWPAVFDSGELADGAMPKEYLMQRLAAAGNKGKRGEVVLWSLLALGEKPLAEIHPQAVAAVVTALRQVGLRDEAKAVVLDVMLAKTSTVGS
ncbi:MAG: hypothetical protein KUG61_08765 [Parvibaculaceae bacterium]|nr:hypothetical protein [Parvibaculaceae bacterium]